MDYGLGLLPDIEDSRDLLFSQAPIPQVLDLPKSVDLRQLQAPITNPERLGCCTGHAIAGLRAYLENKHPSLINGKAGHDSIFHRALWKIKSVFGKKEENIYSPLFIYYEIRKKEGNLGFDAGGSIRTGMKILNSVGVCKESLWPYLPRKYDTEPPFLAYQTAKTNQILNYYRINDKIRKLDDIRLALSHKLVVVGGLMLFDSFYYCKNGNVEYPSPNANKLGGHALVIVGYDDAKAKFIIRNSWGREWGDDGYCYAPYDYVNDYAMDLWVADQWK